MLHRPRFRRPGFAVAAALLLLALAGGGRPAAAQGGTDAYTVSGIAVDVTAANPTAARDQAIAEAQRKAWSDLYTRVAPGGGTPPRLSDLELARLVQGFSIEEERSSATRYVGTMTVRFRPDAVRDALSGTTAQIVEPATRPYVVLPVTIVDGRPVLWEDRTPWRQAWEERREGSSFVPLVVPDGELDDIAAIGVNEAMDGNTAALDRIARKYGAAGVVVARTEMPAGGPDLSQPLTVAVTRYDGNGQRAEETVSVRPDPADRAADLLARGPVQVAAVIDAAWRRENVVSTGPEQHLTVVVPVARLDDWVETRRRLSGVNAVSTTLLGLSRTEARVALSFRGDVTRLQEQLARRDLGLVRLPAAAQPVPVPGQPPLPPQEVWQLSPTQGVPAPARF